MRAGKAEIVVVIGGKLGFGAAATGEGAAGLGKVFARARVGGCGWGFGIRLGVGASALGSDSAGLLASTGLGDSDLLWGLDSDLGADLVSDLGSDLGSGLLF
jgi:hypothetical protein